MCNSATNRRQVAHRTRRRRRNTLWQRHRQPGQQMLAMRRRAISRTYTTINGGNSGGETTNVTSKPIAATNMSTTIAGHCLGYGYACLAAAVNRSVVERCAVNERRGSGRARSRRSAVDRSRSWSDHCRHAIFHPQQCLGWPLGIRRRIALYLIGRAMIEPARFDRPSERGLETLWKGLSAVHKPVGLQLLSAMSGSLRRWDGAHHCMRGVGGGRSYHGEQRPIRACD